MSTVDGLRALCQAAASFAGVEGASLSVFSEHGTRARITANSIWAAHLDDLQFDLGEGPCYDAFASALPVDVALPTGSAEFPVFSAAAAELGARWMLAVPVRQGQVTIGVVDLIARQPPDDPGHALLVVGWLLPLLVSGLTQLGDEPEVDGFADELAAYRWEVHRAIGAVQVREHLSAAGALAWLRARAWAADARLEDVARAVIDGADHPGTL